MAWTLTGDISDYHRAAGHLLNADAVRNTVLLSVLASVVSLGPTAFGPQPPLFGWYAEDSPHRTVSAAVLQTPPHPLLITTLPGRSAAQLAGAVAARGISLPGVNGAENDATEFARAWQQITGVSGKISQRQRLYKLGKLVRPRPTPAGAARVAMTADAAVARALFMAFAADVGQDAAPEQLIAARVEAGQLMLWEVDGDPVSIAGVSPVFEGVARIGPVYTPPRWRGRGYGGAVTAAIGELAARRGATSVVLFTDLANPQSNSLYRKLGYHAVEDRALLLFHG